MAPKLEAANRPNLSQLGGMGPEILAVEPTSEPDTSDVAKENAPVKFRLPEKHLWLL